MRLRNSILQVVHSPAAARHGYEQPWYRRVGTWLGRLAILACLSLAAILVSSGAPQGAGSSPEWRSVGQGEAWPQHDIVMAGQEAGLPLYPCRGVIGGELHVGRARADFGNCHIGYDGNETKVAPYELLTATWHGGGSAVSTGAYNAGAEVVTDGEGRFSLARLAICHAAYEGGVHSGQAKAGERGCTFGYGGRQVVAASYDVLQPAPWMIWTAATPRDLPLIAIVSGMEGGEPFFACRAADRTGLHPGKIKRTSLGCSIASDGKEANVARFEVLVPRWSVGSSGTSPVAAYPAGQESGGSQFVCRAQSRDTLQIGKVNERLGGCHVGMQGREVVFKEYEVLAQ